MHMNMNRTGRKVVIVKNSSIGFLSQIMSLFFTFLTRSFFIKYIGVELLGLNSTFTSVIGTLSLVELGFYSAIAYNLYKPLHDDDREVINDILNILKLVYRVIGAFFIVASFATLPFLKYIVTDFEVTSELYVFFLIQAAASTCSYFLAYKRTILYADQKEYISKLVDMTTNAIISILQCVTLVIWGNYVIYLVLKIIQTYISNFIVHIYCTKHYRYLHPSPMNKAIFKKIWSDVKNVFAAKIAGYVYGSTDNIVISAFISTVTVGYLVNYTTVIAGLKNLCTALLSPITPIIGNYLVESDAGRDREKVFLLYSHVRYYIAMLVVAPTIVAIDSFIALWVGEGLILSKSIVILLGMEFYMHIIHGSTTDFIFADGLFRQERNVEVAGALTNIITSIILAQFVNVQGVLIGTVISQCVFWIGRSWVVYFRCLNISKARYIFYWIKNVVYTGTFSFVVLASQTVISLIGLSDGLLKFIIAGVITECIAIVVMMVVFLKDNAQSQLLSIVREVVEKNLLRKQGTK